MYRIDLVGCFPVLISNDNIKNVAPCLGRCRTTEAFQQASIITHKKKRGN